MLRKRGFIIALFGIAGAFVAIGVAYALTAVLTPATIYITTEYSEATEDYEGWALVNMDPDEGGFDIWAVAEEIDNIDLIEIDGEDWGKLYEGVPAIGTDFYVSVVKSNQDEGQGVVLLYEDDGDKAFDPAPGGGDTFLDGSTLWVDDCR